MRNWLQSWGQQLSAKIKQPSLQSCLIAVMLLVLAPTLCVAAMALLRATQSYRDASARQLLETAHVVAQSVSSEIEATARPFSSYVTDSPGEPGGARERPAQGASTLFGERVGSILIKKGPSGFSAGSVAASGGPEALAVTAASTGHAAVSNIFAARDDGKPRLALAVPRATASDDVEVVTLVSKPTDLIHTLSRRGAFASNMVLAVTDGTGHIIARSRDAEDFIGKPVPDWAGLQAIGQPQGTFEARTLEGPKVMFAFQTISGTPGWTAVVGEPLSNFNSRWQQPLFVMIGASCLTVVVALLLALLLTRRILRPIKGLVQHSLSVAAGKGLDQPISSGVPHSFIAEFETLRRSLNDAEAELRRSAQAERSISQTLAASERRYRTIAQTGALAFWARDLAGALTSASGLHSLAGIDEKLSVGDSWHDRIHPADRVRIDLAWETALARQEPIDVEFRIESSPGVWRWLRSRGSPVLDDDGAPVEWIGVIEDITARKTAEDDLHLQRERLALANEALRQAEELARIGNWSMDVSSGQFSCSDTLHEINGSDPNGPPLTPADLQRLLTPESFERADAALRRCREEGIAYDIEIEHLRPDGSRIATNAKGQANRDSSGRIVSLAGTVQDITERHEARARLAALADNLPSGAIYRLERQPDGRPDLSYISGSIYQLIGISATEIIQNPAVFQHAIHPDDLSSYQAAIEQSIETGHVFDYEFRINTRDGRLIWMQCRSAPRRQSDGRTVWDGVMRDITGERLVAEALRQAKDTAEAAERAKSDFLAMMSHEIRTPMNTVIGMTRLTLQTDLAPKQRNYLEKINTSARTLLEIINDVLDFSKIEAGGLVLENTEFAIESVLDSVSAVTAMRAEEKGLEIAYSIAADVPRNLAGDPLRLGQVLTNLVGNAIKFTTSGEVVVSASMAPPEDGASMLRFCVRDTGIGLSADQIASLFRPFTQAESHTTRHYGGTGLGLAICKRLVEMLGGRIWIESTPGQGSAFFFTITLRQAPDTVRPMRPGSLKDRRVLIVDDNASARQILRDIVRGFGMAADAVESGEQALDALLAAERDRPFDIVLMDWRMPVMDGLETARRIRAQSTLHHMPAVLMVTAYARDEVLLSVEQLGLQGLLIKPVTESVMFNTLLDILSVSDGEGSEEASSPSRAEHQTGDEFAGLAGKYVLVVDDNALNREVATDFLLAVGIRVDTAIDGLDALDKLALSNYDAVLMDMHMPRMDGLEAVREIRKQARWATLPVISLTAQARIEDRQASLAAGMTAYLSKPIDEQSMYRTLLDVLRAAPAQASEAQESSRTPEASAAESARSPVFDLSATLRRFGNKRERVERLLVGFLRDFDDAPRLLDNYVRTGDDGGIASLAHALKGSASYLDAEEFCAVADALENAARKLDRGATAAYAPHFSRQLQALLAAIRDGLADMKTPPSSTPVLPIDPRVLDMVAQAVPLVARGEYAAQALLEKIGVELQGRPECALVQDVLTYYDDLELAAAEAALLLLQTRLEAACAPRQ